MSDLVEEDGLTQAQAVEVPLCTGGSVFGNLAKVHATRVIGTGVLVWVRIDIPETLDETE